MRKLISRASAEDWIVSESGSAVEAWNVEVEEERVATYLERGQVVEKRMEVNASIFGQVEVGVTSTQNSCNALYDR